MRMYACLFILWTIKHTNTDVSEILKILITLNSL